MKEETYRYIRKPWIGGNGTLCIGIPAKIVKQLRIDQDSYLLFDIVDDSIIAIKRYNPQFTKSEIEKIQNHPDDMDQLSVVEYNKDDTVTKRNFQNPLDRLDNI